MLELKREKTFKKDLSKVKMTDKHYAKYISYISKLLEKKPLPPEAKDHALIGNFNGAREFHISGDLIMNPLINYECFQRALKM